MPADFLSSTEVLTLGSISWRLSGSLQYEIRGPRAVNFNNTLILTGSYSKMLDTHTELVKRIILLKTF